MAKSKQRNRWIGPLNCLAGFSFLACAAVVASAWYAPVPFRECVNRVTAFASDLGIWKGDAGTAVAESEEATPTEEEENEALLASIEEEQTEPPVETLPSDDETVTFYPARRNRTSREAARPNEFSEAQSTVAEADEDSPFETKAPAREENDDEPAPARNPSTSGKLRKPTVTTAEFESEGEANENDSTVRDRTRSRAVQAAAETERTKDRAAAPSSATIDLKKIDAMLAAGEEIPAHKLMSQWYWKLPDQRATFQKRLDELANSRFFSPRPLFGEPYEIQPGDQLRKVALQYKLSWQYLAKLNKVDPRKVRAGQKLKVVEGPFSAVVDISDYELTVHCHGYFVKKYRVGLGKDGSTPLGEFVVKEKLEDPTYYGPNGEVKASDDPTNPLGERWIDIGDSFGIHGTIEPESIGRNESRGCVRMLNPDVEEVYDLLTIGSPVRIQR